MREENVTTCWRSRCKSRSASCRITNTERQLLLTYGKYRERARAVTTLMTGKWARFLSWVRQGDNTRRGWHHSRDDGDESSLYHLALHYIALLCERESELHLRAFMAWRHLSISRLIAVCVSPLSREIVTQLWVVGHELHLAFPSKLVNHSTRRLDSKNAVFVAQNSIVLIWLLQTWFIYRLFYSYI